jgi:uncharacterized protein YndB with AHSA1/START domain
MESNNELVVEAERVFSVPVDLLYDAWTKPDLLKQWWKPIGNRLEEVKNDIKEGGSVTYIFSDNAIRIAGKYKEVREKEKLVYTWNWEMPDDAVRNGEFLLTVEFQSNGNGSSLHIRQANFNNNETMLPHQQGWNKGLDDLEQFLNNYRANANSSTTANNVQQPTEGYRETPEQQKVAGG